MSPDFYALESRWMEAVQQRDKQLLKQILDDEFVCTAWSSKGELTSREEYLASADSAEFGCCTVTLDHVQQLSDTAVVRCHISCDCNLGERSWKASFLVTDVWALRGAEWKAVSRHTSVPLGKWPAMFAPGEHEDRRNFQGQRQATRT